MRSTKPKIAGSFLNGPKFLHLESFQSIPCTKGRIRFIFIADPVFEIDGIQVNLEDRGT